MGLIDSFKQFYSGKSLAKVILGKKVPSNKVERYVYEWLAENGTGRIEQLSIFINFSLLLGADEYQVAWDALGAITKAQANEKSFGLALGEIILTRIIWPENPSPEQVKGREIFESKFSEIKNKLVSLD